MMKPQKPRAQKTAALLLLTLYAAAFAGADESAPAYKIPDDIPIEMVFVEGGTFKMGCVPKLGDSAKQQEYCNDTLRNVTVSSFYIGKYEVTQRLWKLVMGEDNNPSKFKGDDLPVESVSWVAAQYFIARLNILTGKRYRLPTEAEWEYAARGGNKSGGYEYAGGDNLDEVAWYGGYKGNSGETTNPVGGKKANELGIYDMSGNVTEWVHDWCHDYDRDRNYYQSGPKINPTGPDSGSFRMTRGGDGLDQFSGGHSVTDDNGYSPDRRSYKIGFRLALPAQAWESGKTAAALKGGTLTVSGKGAMEDYNGRKKNPPWRDFIDIITAVIIKNGVTSIGDSAFAGCKNLTSVTIPGSVKTIGESAFENCTSLTSVNIPSGVASVGMAAFENCAGLASVTISNSVKTIGWGAFGNCTSLKSIAIPSGVTDIRPQPFSGCTSLTEINVAAGNAEYRSIDGVLFSKSKAVLIQYPAGKQGAYNIPDSVIVIMEGAFHGSAGLTSVTIPSSVNDALMFLSGPEPVFYRCENLTSINIDEGNPDFSSVDGVWFNKNKTGLIEYPAGRPGAYIIPNGVEYIGYYAFSRCNGLTSVAIPDGAEHIGTGAFSYCANLSSVTIPNSVTEIRSGTFMGCASLSSITIPESVTEIGRFAFADCDNLTEIIILNPVPPELHKKAEINIKTFSIDENSCLYVPAAKGGGKPWPLRAYRTATGWKEFKCVKELAPTPATVAAAAQGSFTDARDGQTYRTVTIGGKRWMAENLNYETGRSWCYKNAAFNCDKYGRLYTWLTAMGACPAGWRLPTTDEWDAYTVDNTFGARLKSKPPEWDGTDDFGFSALPGGRRDEYGRFTNLGERGYWWTSALRGNGGGGSTRFTMSERTWVGSDNGIHKEGFSVRCVQED